MTPIRSGAVLLLFVVTPICFIMLIYLFFSLLSALLELPSNVTLGPNAKVATLPGDCHATHKPNETVLITGTGDVTIEDTAYNTLPMLRQATTTTMSGGECASTINTDMDQRSLICARVTDGQAAYEGDSGEFDDEDFLRRRRYFFVDDDIFFRRR